jgi:hypothetical protein
MLRYIVLEQKAGEPKVYACQEDQFHTLLAALPMYRILGSGATRQTAIEDAMDAPYYRSGVWIGSQ